MGAVPPAYRRGGIARSLAEAREGSARARGYDSITFNTRNQHKNMLIFAPRRGFDIAGFEEKAEIETNRIWLRKVL